MDLHSSALPFISERRENRRVPRDLTAQADHLPPRLARTRRLPPKPGSGAARAQPRARGQGARGMPGFVVLGYGVGGGQRRLESELGLVFATTYHPSSAPGT